MNRSLTLTFTRRRWLAMLAYGIAFLPALDPMPARADGSWPNRPIRLIVPYAPGGGSDNIARVIAAKLSARLGQTLVVENKAGAGGVLGVDAVAKSAPDGYTLLFTTTAMTTLAAGGRPMPYDLGRDLTPIGEIGATPLLVMVAAKSDIKTLGDLVTKARAKPLGVSYGSSGFGSMSHVGMEFVAAEAKMQLLHVPYKGLSAVLTDMVGGNIETAIGTFSSAAPLMKSGAVRGLVVTGTQRSPFAPEIPTAAEAGLPGFRIDFWWGLMAPAKVPAPILKRLNEELNAVLQQPEVRDALAQEAAVPKPGTAEDFGQLLDAEVKRWSKLIKDANIKME